MHLLCTFEIALARPYVGHTRRLHMLLLHQLVRTLLRGGKALSNHWRPVVLHLQLWAVEITQDFLSLRLSHHFVGK